MAKSTRSASSARSTSSHGRTNSKAPSRRLRIFSTSRSCLPPPVGNTTSAEKRLPAALLEPLEDAHVIRYSGATHVEDAAQPGLFHLKIAGTAHKLHRSERVHGHAGRADRVTFCFETAGGIHRESAVLLRPALRNRASALPFGGQPHGLVFDEFCNGEAIVRLDEGEIAKLESRLRECLLPGMRATFELQDVPF